MLRQSSPPRPGRSRPAARRDLCCLCQPADAAAPAAARRPSLSRRLRRGPHWLPRQLTPARRSRRRCLAAQTYVCAAVAQTWMCGRTWREVAAAGGRDAGNARSVRWRELPNTRRRQLRRPFPGKGRRWRELSAAPDCGNTGGGDGVSPLESSACRITCALIYHAVSHAVEVWICSSCASILYCCETHMYVRHTCMFSNGTSTLYCPGAMIANASTSLCAFHRRRA